MDTPSQPPGSLPAALPNPRQREELRRAFQQAVAWLQYQPERAAEGMATLLACVRGDPGNGIFVETLLKHLRIQPPLPAPWFAWFVGKNGKLPAESLDWNAEWANLWQALRTQPRRWEAASRLAALAQRAGFPEVEALLRRYAAEVGRGDSRSQTELALLLVRQGSLEEAAALWQEIGANTPDSAAAVHFAECWARNVPPWPLSVPSAAEKVSRGFIYEFHGALNHAEFVQAQQSLTQFTQQQGNPSWLAEWQEVLFLLRAEHAIHVGEALLNDPLVPTTAETIAHLKGDLLRRELDQFTRRAERQPERLEWQWEAAVRLKQLGNFSAAIQALEPLAVQPRWQPAAHLELAECWQRLRQFERALEYYGRCVVVEDSDSATVRTRALAQGQRLAAALGKANWPG